MCDKISEKREKSKRKIQEFDIIFKKSIFFRVFDTPVAQNQYTFSVFNINYNMYALFLQRQS